METAQAHYGKNVSVSLEPLENWEATSYLGEHGRNRLERLNTWEVSLNRVLEAWLFDELRYLTNSERARLAALCAHGRERIVEDVVYHLRGVINPTAGWNVQITAEGFYALDWAEIALEAEGRVLFLHFSFSD